MGLRALRPSSAIVKVMSVRDSQCIRVVTPDDHVACGFHEIWLHDMGEEELPFVVTSELDYLRRIWPRALFAFMTRYQQDLERKWKECKERFGCTQSENFTHCGKYIQMDLGKHIAFYHLELAQLWRCPVMWCMVWKGTAQDCIDHMRRTHKVPLPVKAANLSKFFPAWTVTREQWADMLMPSISGVVITSSESDRKSCGFPGHVPTSSVYLPRRIRLCSGTLAPPSACSGISLPCSAAYRQSGEWATSIYSQTPDCFSVTTTASPERSYQCGQRAGVKLSHPGRDVFRPGIDGSRAP